MAINKNKVMEAAQKFVEKNQIDKAIKEYQKIVEEDPKDVRVWLKLGDLHARKNDKHEATETYLRVAQFYSDQGFYLKAVAVYKQVLRLDPRLIDVNVRLAEVYRQLGLLSDAMQQYELVAAFFHREGKTREALATVRELVELDPENVATRIKLAELYSKEQMVKEAVAEFAKACDYLRANGRLDDFIKVAERLVWHQPDNHGMNRELAQLYLRRNDPRHALQKLQVCFKADPRDIETLALLASAFLALDQRQKTVSVWKELARIHTENNQPALAQDVYRRILSVSPDDPDALAASGGRRAVGTGNQPAVTAPSPPAAVAAPPPPAAPSPPPPRVVTPIGSEPGERPVQRLATPLRSVETPAVPLKGPARVATPLSHQAPAYTARPASKTRPPLGGGASDGVAMEVAEGNTTNRSRAEPTTLDLEHGTQGTSRPTQIARLIDAAETCAKYGLRDKAIAQLQRLLEIDPRSVDARARLKDNLHAVGRQSEAADEVVRLIEICAGHDRARAEQYLAELAETSAGDPRVQELMSHYGLRSPEEIADDLEIEIVQGTVPPGIAANEPDDDASGLPEEPTAIGDEAIDDEMTVIGDGTMELDSAELAVEVAGDDELDNEMAFDDVGGGSTDQGDKTVDIGSSSLEIDYLDALDRSAGEVDVSIDPSDEALAESMGTSEPPVRGVTDFDRAPATERPAGLGRGPATLAPGTTLEDDLDEADFFVSQSLFDEARAILHDLLTRHPNHPLLVAKLRDLPADGSAGGTDPGRSGPRRPAVIAKAEGGGDAGADTHYDLGIAYKEMGLFEEALKEFALARQGVGKAVQSYMMIGLCQIELGRMSEAVEAFKAGLYVDGINEFEALALYFELGVAYEALGDAREALYYYEKVHKRDPRFRDVETRIAGLAPQPPSSTRATGPHAARGNGGAKVMPMPRREMRDGSDDDALSALDSLLDERDVTPS